MDYCTQLLKEHSRINMNGIAELVGHSPIEFKKIIEIIYNEKPPLPQRASWILAIVNNTHPELLVPYLSLFIDTVSEFKVNGIKRNMMVVLSKHTIPEELQGKLIDVCFNLILSNTETVVVKTEAMQCISNIAKEHPAIANELKLVIMDQLPKTTAAFHLRAEHILKSIN
ncbi:MAG: hypothetical protein ABI315_08025 [Bacteroidia bacterium]